MENENIHTDENFEDTKNNIYAEALAEMRGNTVPKEEYEKAVEEVKRLTGILVEGREDDAATAAEEKADIKTLRQKFLSGEDMSNLEYWENTLALRDAIMEDGGADPFLPMGQKISATAEDVQKANNVATVIRECIEYAQGDSAIFTNELQRRTVDTAPAVKARRK